MYAAQPDKEFKKVMDYKQSNIEKSQRSTQESIRVSGSATDATLVLVAMMQTRDEAKWDTTKMKTVWEFWREYFFKQRDIDETYKSLTDPF